MKEVVIKCTGSMVRDIKDLENFQGNLKVLTDENYKKLKKEILELGFCEAITVWNNKILNGHQRVTVLRKMREEGYVIPPIPVNTVDAKDKAEAKRIILSLTSQFGKITSEGLYEFMKEAEIDLDEVMSSFSFSDVDLNDVKNLFGNDSMEIELGDVEDEDLPDVDIEGEVLNKTDYIILTFDDGENVNDILQQLGVKNNIKRISYKNFMGKMK